jgi:hypothetical protein
MISSGETSATVLSFVTSIAWLEWAKVIFDLIKGVAWPLAAFLIVWIFRAQLRERIRDLISVGPTGAVLQAPSQNASGTKPTADLSPPTHALRTAQRLITRIENELHMLPEEQRQRRLIESLAEARVERAFEWVFSLIFGSQILALRELTKSDSISLEDAERFFDETVKPLNPSLYSEAEFKDWARFLFDQQLIKSEGSRVSITEIGQDFLMFVGVQKPNVTRPN